MSEETNAPSNGAGDEVVVAAEVQPPEVETSQVEQTEKPSGSAREAVEKALAAVSKPADEPKPEVRKNAAGREIGPDGKFVAGEKPVQKAELKPETVEQKPAVIVGQPPQRFSKIAQESWAQTPEPVRQEIDRAITELTSGIEQYKTAFEPIRKYDEMARKSGTTLDKALEAYTGIEDLITRDPIAGLVQVCRNTGLDPRAVGAAMANMQQLPQAQTPQRESAEVAALKQEIAALKGEFGGFTSQLAQREAQKAIDDFAGKHPHFDDVAESVAQLLEGKIAKDLSDAYQKAVLLNPEIAAKIKAEEDAKKTQKPDPAQTREKAKLSITGSPSAGSIPSTEKPAGSAREALQRAAASQGLHL